MQLMVAEAHSSRLLIELQFARMLPNHHRVATASAVSGRHRQHQSGREVHVLQVSKTVSVKSLPVRCVLEAPTVNKHKILTVHTQLCQRVRKPCHFTGMHGYDWPLPRNLQGRMRYIYDDL